jgi:hypothetical protein
VFPVIGATLVILGGVLLYAGTVWPVESRYTVTIDAPQSLSWTLGFPRPQIPMAMTIEGDARVGPMVSAQQGTFEDFSGTGAVILRYASHVTFYGSDPMQRSWSANLSGQ